MPGESSEDCLTSFWSDSDDCNRPVCNFFNSVKLAKSIAQVVVNLRRVGFDSKRFIEIVNCVIDLSYSVKNVGIIIIHNEIITGDTDCMFKKGLVISPMAQLKACTYR